MDIERVFEIIDGFIKQQSDALDAFHAMNVTDGRAHHHSTIKKAYSDLKLYIEDEIKDNSR